MKGYCPNTEVCKLYLVEGFAGNEEQRMNYIQSWCQSGKKKWANCTRYVVKEAIHFCPDFVLPDSVMTPDEVIDRFDQESE